MTSCSSHTHKRIKERDSDRQSGLHSITAQTHHADALGYMIIYVERRRQKSGSNCWILNSNMGPDFLSLLLKMLWWWAQRKFGPHLKWGCWCPGYQNRPCEWLLMSRLLKQTLLMAACVQVIETDPVNGYWCPSYQNRPCEWLLIPKLSKQTLWMAADVQVIKTNHVNGLVAPAYAS